MLLNLSSNYFIINN